MKKNLIILENSKIFTEKLCKIFKKENMQIITLNESIYNLENSKSSIIYPIDKKNTNFKLLTSIIKNKIKTLDSIIINTDIPLYTKPLEQINDYHWEQQIYKNINTPFYLIKNMLSLLKKTKNPNINIIIHKNPANIKAYWSITECINNGLIALMETINEEYKNINNLRINCISTENINSLYKKNIYPYKVNQNDKNLQHLVNTLIYLIKSNIKNKIIKV